MVGYQVHFTFTYGLTLIPVCVSNHTHYKAWDEITYPFPKFNGTVEIWEWLRYSPYILLGMWLLINAGIEVQPCK